MKLAPALRRGILLRRYKRFLADVETGPGQVETMHCPNTGAMTGCDQPGSECWYSVSDNTRRKYPCTLEVVVTPEGAACINTGRANQLVAEALSSGRLEGFEQARLSRAEVPVPDEKGRFDFLLNRAGSDCYVEVKSVTLCRADGLGLFPDAVSERALKHVNALQRRVIQGDQAALIFCVVHTGIRRVTPAEEIDPVYADAVRQAARAGVEVRAYGCVIEPDEFRLQTPLPVSL